jgi:hypothetical protein
LAGGAISKSRREAALAVGAAVGAVVVTVGAELVGTMIVRVGAEVGDGVGMVICGGTLLRWCYITLHNVMVLCGDCYEECYLYRFETESQLERWRRGEASALLDNNTWGARSSII